MLNLNCQNPPQLRLFARTWPGADFEDAVRITRYSRDPFEALESLRAMADYCAALSVARTSDSVSERSRALREANLSRLRVHPRIVLVHAVTAQGGPKTPYWSPPPQSLALVDLHEANLAGERTRHAARVAAGTLPAFYPVNGGTP